MNCLAVMRISPAVDVVCVCVCVMLPMQPVKKTIPHDAVDD
jgi:hypothetical protein